MPDYAALDAWAQNLVATENLVNTDISIFRNGKIDFTCRHGYMDLNRQRPLLEDAIFRIYSMTKPVVCVAVMQLLEHNKLKLTDPVSNFIPSFSELFVAQRPNGRTAAARDITVHDLLTHTSGLTYGGSDYPPVSTSYRTKGIDFSVAYASLAELADLVGSCDLYYQPGSRWIYSIANDILGRIVEVASGMPLDRFLSENIFVPLGMTDTGFHVGEKNIDRFVANFGYDSSGKLTDISDGSNDRFLKAGTLLSGGGGLVSTARDYMAFAKMMLGKGSLDGVKILKASTVDLMTQNHLAGDLPSMGCQVHSTMDMSGIGYGYGVAVTIDQNQASINCSNGDYGWGGVANTYFWVDPAENMIVLFLSQLMPASDLPVRAKLRELVYSTIL